MGHHTYYERQHDFGIVIFYMTSVI